MAGAAETRDDRPARHLIDPEHGISVIVDVHEAVVGRKVDVARRAERARPGLHVDDLFQVTHPIEHLNSGVAAIAHVQEPAVEDDTVRMARRQAVRTDRARSLPNPIDAGTGRFDRTRRCGGCHIRRRCRCRRSPGRRRCRPVGSGAYGSRSTPDCRICHQARHTFPWSRSAGASYCRRDSTSERCRLPSRPARSCSRDRRGTRAALPAARCDRPTP